MWCACVCFRVCEWRERKRYKQNLDADIVKDKQVGREREKIKEEQLEISKSERHQVRLKDRERRKRVNEKRKKRLHKVTDRATEREIERDKSERESVCV